MVSGDIVIIKKPRNKILELFPDSLQPLNDESEEEDVKFQRGTLDNSAIKKRKEEFIGSYFGDYSHMKHDSDYNWNTGYDDKMYNFIL